MTSNPKNIAPSANGPADDEVASYLKDNPDFLLKHPDLIRLLTPPAYHQGDGVVDLQQFMLDRLREDLRQTRAERDDLVALSRSNLSGQTQIHKSILALLEAQDFEQFVHFLTTDLAMHLGIDIVTVCVEVDENPPPANDTGVIILPAGTIAQFFDPADENAIYLKDGAPDLPLVFGGGAALVNSHALIRLRFGHQGRQGLLALGARTTGTFTADQGTDLLTFLGRVVETCTRRWLNLPD